MNNSVILIDDNERFSENFKNEAFANNILISHKKSLDGLKDLLPKHSHKYAAIILDIKCLITDSQVKEDTSFIGAALSYLNTNCPKFPRFILTGDESEFEGVKRYFTDEKMFIKKPEDLVKLFKELNYCIQNAEHLQIKRENYSVFETFETGLLPFNKEVLALSIFKRYSSEDLSTVKGVIADIRELHEEVYKALNSRNKNIMPDNLVDGNGSPKFNALFHNHMLGNPDRLSHNPTSTVYQDSTINSATRFIQNACSEFIHSSSKIGYNISPYTVKSLINALMEIIVWSKNY